MKFKTGIYKIVNLINGKEYIGSAVNLERRKNEHFKNLKKNNHFNGHLQNSYNKHGKENFKFEVIMHCLPEYLLFFEQMHIDKYDFKKELYNISPTAGSSLGVKFSEETKNKIGRLASERYQGKNNPFYGKKHTEETKNKIRKANLGKKASKKTRNKLSRLNSGENNSNYGKKQSKEQRLKNSTPVKAYIYKTKEFIGDFESQKKAAEVLNIIPSHIPSILRGHRNHTHGYTFEFLNKPINIKEK